MPIENKTDPSRVKTSKDLDLRAVAPFIALGLLLLLGAIVNPNFLSADNLLNVTTLYRGRSSDHNG